MLKRLQAWWKSTEPAPSFENEPFEKIDKAEITAHRAAVRRFVTEAFSFVSVDGAEKLKRRVDRVYGVSAEDGIPDASAVLVDALRGNPFTCRPRPFVFVFDARYVEDTQKVVSAVWASYGQQGVFEYDENSESADPLQMLAKLQEWAQERSYAVLFIDTGGDEYVGLFCPVTHVDAMCSQARDIEVALTLELR